MKDKRGRASAGINGAAAAINAKHLQRIGPKVSFSSSDCRRPDVSEGVSMTTVVSVHLKERTLPQLVD